MKRFLFSVLALLFVLVLLPAMMTAVSWADGPVVGKNGMVSWDKNPAADLAGYKIFLGESPGQYTRMQDVNLTNSPDTPEASLLGFKLVDGQYYLAIEAYNDAGNHGEASDEVPFVYKASAPPKVTGVQVRP